MNNAASFEHQIMVSKLNKPGDQLVEEMTPFKAMLNHMVMGIAGEAGEIVDVIKKHTMYGLPLDEEHLTEELGDIEFYLEGLRQLTGIIRERALRHNLSKLAVRYRDYEYSNQAALERADKIPDSEYKVPACFSCDKTWNEEPLYRQNEEGEMPAVWACREHLTREVDPEVQDIVNLIENHND